MTAADQFPMDEQTIYHAKVCQALADPKRIRILYALDDRPRHVTGLAQDLDIPQPTVSRHLRVLKQQALVKGERVGAAVIYRINDRRIIEALNTVQEIMVENIGEQS